MQAKGGNAHPFVASLIVLCGAFLQSVASERTGSALSSDLGEAAETGLSQISASIHLGIEMARMTPKFTQ